MGRYDFTLGFSPEDYPAMLIRAAISAGSLSDAVQQVGLRLEPRKSPLDVLVVDDAQKTPTAN